MSSNQTQTNITMGMYISTLMEKLFQQAPARVCMIGLDGAGKTTVLYKMKFNETVTTIPTIGFNVDEITIKNLTLTVWDVGGQHKIRPLWQYYFENNDAVVYVVDSMDRERFEEARDELSSVLSDDRLRNTILLLLANKQDLPGAASVSEITDKFELAKLRHRQWFVQGTCGVNGDGLVEGFTWLADAIKKERNERRIF